MEKKYIVIAASNKGLECRIWSHVFKTMSAADLTAKFLKEANIYIKVTIVEDWV